MFKVVVSFPLVVFSPGLSEIKFEVKRKCFRPLCSKQQHETVRKQVKLSSITKRRTLGSLVQVWNRPQTPEVPETTPYSITFKGKQISNIRFRVPPMPQAFCQACSPQESSIFTVCSLKDNVRNATETTSLKNGKNKKNGNVWFQNVCLLPVVIYSGV